MSFLALWLLYLKLPPSSAVALEQQKKEETEAFRHLILVKLSCLYYTVGHQG